MTQRIYLGVEDDEAQVLRTLLDMVEDPRQIVWVGGERAVDVPDEVADKFTSPAPTKKATKAAKAAPAPAPDSGKTTEE